MEIIDNFLHFIGINTGSSSTTTPPPLPPRSGSNDFASTLANTDNFQSMLSSGLVSGVITARTAGDIGVVGHEVKAVKNLFHSYDSPANVRNYDDYNPNAYSEYNRYGNNNNYNNNGYGARPGLGAVERTMNVSKQKSAYAEYVEDNMKATAMNHSLKNIATNTMSAVKYGSLIGGGVSAVVNTYKVITGKETGSGAVAAVAADTITTGLSSAAGAVAGGFTALSLGMMGLGVLPGIVLATTIGFAGAAGTQYLFQKTGLYDSLKDKVKGLLP